MRKLEGARAIVGIDMVGFTRLSEEDQLTAIQHLIEWIQQALAYHGIEKRDFRWSPAGDGGYLTFDSTSACRAAIDLAITIGQKAKDETWRPVKGGPIRIKLAVHAGTVAESSELGRETNVWGEGINTTERILGICAPSQILVSQPYFDLYLKARQEPAFTIGEPHWRTVKHNLQVAVRNVYRHDIGLGEREADSSRWQAIAGVWRRTITEFRSLIMDSLKSGEAVPAIAAAKFLLSLEDRETVLQLSQMIGRSETRPWSQFPAQSFFLFSSMPADVLLKVIEQATPRLFLANEILCQEGAPAESCFFAVSGTVIVEAQGLSKKITIPKGQIIGEFSLWIPNIRRTASLRALEDGLFLEINNRKFARVLDDSPEDVAAEVYGVIKRRITENVLASDALFPELTEDLKQLKSKPAITCDRAQPGTELDLSRAAYVLFNGEVSIEPNTDARVTIQAPGRFGMEKVIGIVCEIGRPDGQRAKVLTEAVLVRIPHELLLHWQKTVTQIRDAWERIYGARLGEIRRAGSGEKAEPAAAPPRKGEDQFEANRPTLLKASLRPAPRSKSQSHAVPEISKVSKGHIFLSYCHENSAEVRELRRSLIEAGEKVWWDGDILGGQDWKFEITSALRNSYAVVLCLSKESQARTRTGIYPEALAALEELRKYRPGSIFLIPVRLSECEIPLIEIDAIRSLDRLQHIDLFPGRKRADAIQKLISAIRAAPNHPKWALRQA